jgi:hypothetical protein
VAFSAHYRQLKAVGGLSGRTEGLVSGSCTADGLDCSPLPTTVVCLNGYTVRVVLVTEEACLTV